MARRLLVGLLVACTVLVMSHAAITQHSFPAVRRAPLIVPPPTAIVPPMTDPLRPPVHFPARLFAAPSIVILSDISGTRLHRKLHRSGTPHSHVLPDGFHDFGARLGFAAPIVAQPITVQPIIVRPIFVFGPQLR